MPSRKLEFSGRRTHQQLGSLSFRIENYYISDRKDAGNYEQTLDFCICVAFF